MTFLAFAGEGQGLSENVGPVTGIVCQSESSNWDDVAL